MVIATMFLVWEPLRALGPRLEIKKCKPFCFTNSTPPHIFIRHHPKTVKLSNPCSTKWWLRSYTKPGKVWLFQANMSIIWGFHHSPTAMVTRSGGWKPWIAYDGIQLPFVTAILLLMAEIPNNHLGWCWNPKNNGKNYQPQLVSGISESSTVCWGPSIKPVGTVPEELQLFQHHSDQKLQQKHENEGWINVTLQSDRCTRGWVLCQFKMCLWCSAVIGCHDTTCAYIRDVSTFTSFSLITCWLASVSKLIMESEREREREREREIEREREGERETDRSASKLVFLCVGSFGLLLFPCLLVCCRNWQGCLCSKMRSFKKKPNCFRAPHFDTHPNKIQLCI